MLLLETPVRQGVLARRPKQESTAWEQPAKPFWPPEANPQPEIELPLSDSSVALLIQAISLSGPSRLPGSLCRSSAVFQRPWSARRASPKRRFRRCPRFH